MDGAHGNSPYQRAMAQRPEPLRRPPDTELAFFRRLLRKQERELAEISKKAYRKDHSSRSRETLEARSRTRETGKLLRTSSAKWATRARRDETETEPHRPQEVQQGHMCPHPPHTAAGDSKTAETYGDRHHGGPPS